MKAYLDIREINGYSVHKVEVHQAEPDFPGIMSIVYIGTPSNPQFVGSPPPKTNELARLIYHSRGPSGENRFVGNKFFCLTKRYADKFCFLGLESTYTCFIIPWLSFAQAVKMTMSMNSGARLLSLNKLKRKPYMKTTISMQILEHTIHRVSERWNLPFRTRELNSKKYMLGLAIQSPLQSIPTTEKHLCLSHNTG